MTHPHIQKLIAKAEKAKKEGKLRFQHDRIGLAGLDIHYDKFNHPDKHPKPKTELDPKHKGLNRPEDIYAQPKQTEGREDGRRTRGKNSD